MCTNRVFGSASCWLNSLPLDVKWKSSYWGITVPKAADKHISPKSPEQLCSSNLLSLDLLLSTVPLQKEAEYDASPLHIAQGSWHERDGKREAIYCVTHQALSPA